LPWSPLASGFLSGKYQKGAAPPPGARLEKWQDSYRRFDNERNWTILDAVRTVADELNATPSQVSLAWLLTRPMVVSVIIGARSLEQLADNVKAAEIAIAGEAADCLTDASAFDLGYPYSFMKNIQGRW
jgi:aryl-alcohol dehydrogenase-like predicted oxidoreductase